MIVMALLAVTAALLSATALTQARTTERQQPTVSMQFKLDRQALRRKTSRHPIPDYIVICESHGNLHALNPSGAGGRYQIMPSTWAANLPRARPVKLAGGNKGPQWSSRLLQDIVAGKVARSSGLSAWSCA